MTMTITLPKPLADLQARYQQFWRERNGRERLILTLGAALLAILMIDLVLIEPLTRERARLSRSLPELRTTAANFARDIDALKGQTVGRAGDIGQLATAAGLAPPAVRIDAGQPRQTRLQADNVAWTALTELMAQAQQQGWVLQHVSAKSTGDGKVNAELEWKR